MVHVLGGLQGLVNRWHEAISKYNPMRRLDFDRTEPVFVMSCVTMCVKRRKRTFADIRLQRAPGFCIRFNSFAGIKRLGLFADVRKQRYSLGVAVLTLALHSWTRLAASQGLHMAVKDGLLHCMVER